MKIEKREAPRTLIKIKVNIEGEEAFLYDYSRDMCEGGIFICTKKPLKVGENIRVRFILPELLEEIEAGGVVKWVNPPGSKEPPPGMGISFIDLPSDKKALIQEVIERIEGGKGVPRIGI